MRVLLLNRGCRGFPREKTASLGVVSDLARTLQADHLTVRGAHKIIVSPASDRVGLPSHRVIRVMLESVYLCIARILGQYKQRPRRLLVSM